MKPHLSAQRENLEQVPIGIDEAEQPDRTLDEHLLVEHLDIELFQPVELGVYVRTRIYGTLLRPLTSCASPS